MPGEKGEGKEQEPRSFKEIVEHSFEIIEHIRALNQHALDENRRFEEKVTSTLNAAAIVAVGIGASMPDIGKQIPFFILGTASIASNFIQKYAAKFADDEIADFVQSYDDDLSEFEAKIMNAVKVEKKHPGEGRRLIFGVYEELGKKMESRREEVIERLRLLGD